MSFPGAGRGVRVNEKSVPIPAGTVLLVEHAFVTGADEDLPTRLSKHLKPTLKGASKAELRAHRLVDALYDGRPKYTSVDTPISLGRWAGGDEAVSMGKSMTPAPLPIARLQRACALNSYRCRAVWQEYAYLPNGAEGFMPPTPTYWRITPIYCIFFWISN